MSSFAAKGLPHVQPMLASAAYPLAGDDYVYEVKWDGIRGLAYVTPGRTQLLSRNLNDITYRFPEVDNLHDTLPTEGSIVDGEIVILENGVPSFQAVQNRNLIPSASAAQRAATKRPAVFMAFDLLYHNEENLMQRPLMIRKQMLAECLPVSEYWVLSRHVDGPLMPFLTACLEQGLEGVIAKQRQSPYLPGQRSRHWLKLKRIQSRHFRIGGFTARGRSFGALLLGVPADTHAAVPPQQDARFEQDPGPTKSLLYVGKVGTGFSEADKHRIMQALTPLISDSCPFAPVPRTDDRVVWVRADLVCTVAFLEMTRDGRLRHPTFKGLLQGAAAR